MTSCVNAGRVDEPSDEATWDGNADPESLMLASGRNRPLKLTDLDKSGTEALYNADHNQHGAVLFGDKNMLFSRRDPRRRRDR